MNTNTKANNLYLILAAIFIASLVSCNLIFQKFFQINIWLPFIGSYSFEQSVGLLPYPITFLVTDIISEIYGLKNTIDVYVTLSFFCTADGENHTKEVKADFYEDRTTVLLIERVIGCEPTIQVIYE